MIRPAERREADTVARILRAAYAEYRDHVRPPLEACTVTWRKIARDMRRRRVAYALFVMGETPVGALRYARKRRTVALSKLGVLPAYRGWGVGVALIRWVEERAARAGCRRLEGHVRTALPDLVRFHEQLGYRIVGYRSKGRYQRYAGITRKELMSDTPAARSRGSPRGSRIAAAERVDVIRDD